MAHLGDTSWNLVEDAVHRLESAWHGDGAPGLSQLVPPVGHPNRLRVLVELIKVDQEYRWDAGDHKLLEDYLRDWPELSQEPELLVELLEVECLTLATIDKIPTSEELQGRFPDLCGRIDLAAIASQARNEGGAARKRSRQTPGHQPVAETRSDRAHVSPGALRIRCPHCQNPIEIVAAAPLAMITCPSCGGSFGLAGDRPESGSQQPPRKMAHFELLETLGTGGFGTVWKARDTQLDRIVAVKVPRRGQLDEESVDRFLREARAAAQLRHPNIVSVHEVGREGDLVYIVSDFIEGLPLDKWLSAHKPSYREAAQLCLQIAEALHYAHNQGIVHRDLKPSNILLDAESEPHIMDFGLAKREAGEITMTVEGQILGTPAYMSPEQARGEGHRADRRTDVYSLGVILFELLTGERPFRGDVAMLLKQVVEDDPPSVRKLDGRVPRDLETICAKCTEKAAHRRYDTASALADDLTHYLADEPIHARRTGNTARLWRWARRKPAVAALSAGIILLALFVLIVAPLVAMREQFLRRAALEQARLADKKAREAENEKNRADWNVRKSQVKAKEVEVEKTRAEQHVLSARKSQYALQMGLAQRNILDGNYGDAEDGLAGCFPDMRGWEHAWLCSAIRKRRMELHGHASPVSTVAFSPNGTRIVSGSLDGTLIVWDAAAGRRTLIIEAHAGRVSAVAFSSSGESIVSGGADKALKIWEVATGKEQRTVLGHAAGVTAVAFSPDGKWIVSGSDDTTVKVWDVANGSEKIRFSGHAKVSSVAFSPDGKRVISGGEDGAIKLWDLASGQKQVTLTGHTDRGVAVAYSRDGRRIVSAGGWDRTVRIWDAESQREVSALKGHSGGVTSIAISPDGKRIASGGTDMTVKVWDAVTCREVLSLKGKAGWITGVAFSPDGKRVAAGGLEKTVEVWDIDASPETLTLTGHVGGTSGVAFSPDGRHIVSGGEDKSVKVWDAFTGAEILSLAGHTSRVWSVAFSPDGTRIISGSGSESFIMWNGESGQQILRRTGSGWSVAFSPDGTRIVTGGYDSDVTVLDAERGQEIVRLKGHRDRVGSVAFSPDGKRVASGSFDNSIKLWDTTAGRHVLSFTGHRDFVNGVAFSPDGKRIVSAGDDQAIKVWDATTSKVILTLTGHTNRVCSVAFSPDGKRILSGSADKTAKLWDAEGGQELLTIRGHADIVAAVAFSPDGTRLATGGTDGTVKVWGEITGARWAGQEAPSKVSMSSVKPGLAPPDDVSQVRLGQTGGTAFRLRPRQEIMGSLMNYYRPVRIALSEEPKDKLKAEPNCLSKKPRYGAIELGTGPRNRIVVVVDDPEGGTPRIYIDRNNDKDLTNDGPGEWSRITDRTLGLTGVVIDVPYETATTPYTFEFYRFKDDRRKDYIFYYRDACREGGITLEGKSYKVAVLDDNSDGRFDDLDNGTMVIDLNQDGRLDGDSDSAEYYKLSEPVNVHGKVWEAASLSPDGTLLTMRPSTASVAMKPYLDPGNPAPAFVGKGLDDKTIDLKDEAARAKYVLLDFWASWCGPCRGEFPTMRRLHSQYKDHGLRVLGVNLDSDREKATQAAEEASLGYPHVFDGQGWQNAAALLYRVHAIPQTYLLDKDLKIVAKNLRGVELERRLRELLGPGDEAAAVATEKASAKRSSTVRLGADATSPQQEPRTGKPRVAPARDSRPVAATTPLTSEERIRGFLTNTRDGLRFVSWTGKWERIPDAAGSARLVGRLSAIAGRVFLWNQAEIREIDGRGRVLRTIRPPEGAWGNGFAALPAGRFAILDNRNDKIDFLDADGQLVKTVPMLDLSDSHLQNTHGVVVGDVLVVSEDGERRIVSVNLGTHALSVQRDLNELRPWLGAITFRDGRYYICTADEIHEFRDGGPLRLIARLKDRNITGIEVDSKRAYVPVNASGRIYRVDLTTGAATLFAEGLDYPDGIVKVATAEVQKTGQDTGRDR